MMSRIQSHDLDTKNLFLKRQFEVCAKFIEPYLKPGISLIDCGCGPGNLTLELAKRVYPGQVIGIDMDNSSLIFARAMAKEKKVTNVQYILGNLYELPYSDRNFDIAFSHAVLTNLEFPIAALKEYARVVKRGGIVAVRESDYSALLTYPEKQRVAQCFDLFKKIGELYGDLQIGKRLRELFARAEIECTMATASCESYGTTEEITNFTHYLINQLNSKEIIKIVIDNDWISNDELDACKLALAELAQDPAAFFAYNWIEAIGVVK